jgi:predicted ABC-type transport system involved in lysophospholipase L1 biosynthesis ATPase subunit
MTGNLDAHTGKTILELMFNLNKKNNTTIIFVTHDIDLAKQCDDCYELKDGYLHKC